MLAAEWVWVVTDEGGEESVHERKAEEAEVRVHGWPPTVTIGARGPAVFVPNQDPTISMVVADGMMEIELVWPDTTGAMGTLQGLGEQEGDARTEPEVTATTAAD